MSKPAVKRLPPVRRIPAPPLKSKGKPQKLGSAVSPNHWGFRK